MADPIILILTSLAVGEKHGYAMIQDIESFFRHPPGPGNAVRSNHKDGRAGLDPPGKIP